MDGLLGPQLRRLKLVARSTINAMQHVHALNPRSTMLVYGAVRNMMTSIVASTTRVLCALQNFHVLLPLVRVRC